MVAMKKWIHIVVVLLVAAVVGIAVSEANRKDALALAFENGGAIPAIIRAGLFQAIAKDGSLKTYARLKTLMSQVGEEKQHSIAHIFGDVLYKTDGLSGILVCDASFGFGCYHSFFAAAITQKGETIIQDLDRACVETHGPMGLGCPHGIGHGLGEYFGPDRIDKQLALCSTLTWKGKYLGCQDGVFMEYFTPTEANNDSIATVVRPFNATKAYDICQNVDEKFAPSCFLELGAWWEKAIPNDYSRMGQLCNLAPRVYQESCFLGIGYAFVQSHQYDTQKTIATCESMPSKDAIAVCLGGASWGTFANPAHRSLASNFCAHLPEKQRELCQRASDVLSQ